MPKFRKKPVVIEAVQMTEAAIHDVRLWPTWLTDALRKPRTTPGAVWCSLMNGRMHIGTLEGTHAVSVNDWVIRGIKGELYPCKPDIFEATYERVED